MMRDFRKLVAWQKADDLVVRVYQATESFPSHEQFGLTSQMRRAVVSVAANIAEVCGRHTLKDFRRFLYLARGSLNEVEYFIHLATRLDYFSESKTRSVMAHCHETGRVLQGLINSLTEQIQGGRKYN
jgi:four helix bundle protein